MTRLWWRWAPLGGSLLAVTFSCTSGNETIEPGSGGTGVGGIPRAVGTGGRRGDAGETGASGGGDAGAVGNPGGTGSGGVGKSSGDGGTMNAGGTGGTNGHAGEGGTRDEIGMGGEGSEVVPSFLSPACQDRATALVAVMTLDEKAAQMVQVDDLGISPPEITRLGIGSVLANANFNLGTSAGWAAHIAELHAAARASRLQIPILYALDSMHGMGHASDAIIFPHNVGLGGARDPDLVRRVAHAAAVETSASGVDWTFAPVVAAARDERWGRTYESFSEDPILAGELGASAVLGFQGNVLGADRTSVLASAKHFAGDGSTDGGQDQGDVTLSEADFRALAVSPYLPAIRAGVGAIMVSYSSYHGVAMTENSYWLTSVLKGELGFQGFLITDYGAVQKLGGPADQNVQRAVNAGIDMLMELSSSAVSSISEGVLSGEIPESRVDDAVARILRVKCGLGLFDRSEPDAALASQVGSAKHRELAREAVRKSAVLLKNEGDLLPLAKQSKVVVDGSGSYRRRKQMGGWTIDWQGTNSEVAVGTTLLNAVRNLIGADRVIFPPEDQVEDPTGADAVILAIGEEPYAEFLGDRYNLALDPADADLIRYYAGFEVPVIVVLYSGRPMIITDELASVDAWIAAFLPGSAAEGLADVLFGDYAPTAKLSMTWPASMTQIPINQGDEDDVTDPPLFPFGFGLTY
jgi:beta-glucosidase